MMTNYFDRLIKEFDREVKDLEYKSDAATIKMLNEKKQSMVRFIGKLFYIVDAPMMDLLFSELILSFLIFLCRSKS